MDQYMVMQLLAAAQQDPDAFAKVLAAQGVPPPGGAGRFSPPAGMLTPAGAQTPAPVAPVTPPAPVAPPMAMAPDMQPAAPLPDLSAVPGLAAPDLGALMAPMGATPGGLPGGAPGVPGGPDALMKGLALAGKTVGGSADQRPIMSGGVSRAQMAPDVKIGAGNTAISQDMILKLLLGGGQNPLRVPALGSIMRG